MNRKTGQTDPISFGHAYAQSETFRALFQDGMTLVEETANYLDGEGRAAAKTLTRPSSIVYATESMRLTTRLMQLASWLLLHRSVNDGDMTIAQATEEKRKIRLEQLSTNMNGPGWTDLPEDFKGLVTRSLALQKRVEQIDAAFLKDTVLLDNGNPVADQIQQLAQAIHQKF